MIESIDVEDVRRSGPRVICTLGTAIHPLTGSSDSRSSPFYVPLSDTKSREESIDLLVQTAALPEIFPMRRVLGGKYVDGGVADNTPILGVAKFQSKGVIVVYLDHRFERLLRGYEKKRWREMEVFYGRPFDRITALKFWWEYPRIKDLVKRSGEHRWLKFSSGYMKHWLRNWLRRLSGLSTATRVEDWEEWYELYDRSIPEDWEEWFRGSDLVPIIPSRTLGGFITGTLNFESKKAHALIILGYEDTLEQLRQWCRSAPAN